MYSPPSVTHLDDDLFRRHVMLQLHLAAEFTKVLVNKPKVISEELDLVLYDFERKRGEKGRNKAPCSALELTAKSTSISTSPSARSSGALLNTSLHFSTVDETRKSCFRASRSLKSADIGRFHKVLKYYRCCLKPTWLVAPGEPGLDPELVQTGEIVSFPGSSSLPPPFDESPYQARTSWAEDWKLSPLLRVAQQVATK